MKATGIVRRIDDLGRVVVPKEIRRTLRIREGDPMEIFTDREGEIILKKYSPIRELNLLAQQYADALYQSTGYPVCICDTDQFIAVSGIPKRSMIGQKVHEDLSSAMEKRQYLFARSGEKDYVTLTAGSGAGDFTSQALMAVTCEGDVIGAVILLTRNPDIRFSESEHALLATASCFLGQQMEN